MRSHSTRCCCWLLRNDHAVFLAACRTSVLALMRTETRSQASSHPVEPPPLHPECPQLDLSEVGTFDGYKTCLFDDDDHEVCFDARCLCICPSCCLSSYSHSFSLSEYFTLIHRAQLLKGMRTHRPPHSPQCNSSHPLACHEVCFVAQCLRYRPSRYSCAPRAYISAPCCHPTQDCCHDHLVATLIHQTSLILHHCTAGMRYAL